MAIYTYAALVVILIANSHAFLTPTHLHGVSNKGTVSMAADRLPMGPGSYVAICTPFKDNGEVDQDNLRKMLQWHIAEGTDGIVALGTTGQSAVMTMDERAQVLSVVNEECKGKVPIVVGTGTIDPRKVIDNTKQAIEYGADASLVVTPYYVKPPARGLIKHFTTIADASDLPMMLYNVPGRTGCDMKPETIIELAKHPNIQACKEATGDNSRVPVIREAVGPDFKLYSGDDAGCREFVLAGGDGVVSVTSNVAPKAMAAMMKAAKAGDADLALKLDEPLFKLHKDLFCEANPIPAQWALYKMGKMGLGIRLPLVPLADEHHAKMTEALKSAGSI
mmetsp:Transcript_19570/g.28229  ORF Transcript_19570/g.28229 Transcript_19570/m.28229 type:complete len:335 (-) Transcript_19570:170-1174(-)|eukprot:CAMPEP_0113943434 /NCGR_PEP_ID=MMETSP1339-20121228/23723_1 /TAXON_ID=94617 /ORGANISM="Fibrocapsa japonica" /LENGTH=334 /DNA_ID=CAMNT_0000948299 /DNA_START=57 /DNA_END=1061 /DNA_ORIENTATION=+ /assembly_acc=CAM_ASM_000762